MILAARQLASLSVLCSLIDRILRGARPSELSVETPTKFELVINLKAAKALGLTILESFLLRADGLIGSLHTCGIADDIGSQDSR